MPRTRKAKKLAASRRHLKNRKERAKRKRKTITWSLSAI